MDGLFGDGLVDVLCCGGDSLEEDLRWGPRLGALVDLVEFEVLSEGCVYFTFPFPNVAFIGGRRLEKQIQ